MGFFRRIRIKLSALPLIRRRQTQVDTSRDLVIGLTLDHSKQFAPHPSTISATSASKPLSPDDGTMDSRRVQRLQTVVRGYMRRKAEEEQDRILKLANALKQAKSAKPEAKHTASIHHLQFSPNGEYLATCSSDKTCLIFNVNVRVEEK